MSNNQYCEQTDRFMLDLEPVFEFSRQNCVAICSFLVPANLITAITTVILIIKEQPFNVIVKSIGIAAIFAIALFLHVSTWFIIGIITPVTFILFGLGATCLCINLLAIVYRQQLVQLFTRKLSRS